MGTPIQELPHESSHMAAPLCRGFPNGGILNGGIFKDRWPDILRQALNMQKQEGNYKKYMQNHPKPRLRRGWGWFWIDLL